MIPATKKDLKIGNTVLINMGGKILRHTIRKRLDVAELKKHKIYKHPKEETEDEYKEYKRIIKHYLNINLIYTDSK